MFELPDIDPEHFMQILRESMDGFRRYFVLYHAVKMGIFDALRKPKKIEELANELNCDVELLYIFCNVLENLGLLRKTEAKYVNSKLAETFLDSNSFYSQNLFVETTFENLKLWFRLPEILKNGRVVRNSEFFAKNAIHSLAQNALLGELQKTVKIVSSLPEFRNAKKLLDLGGGHGLYAIAFVLMNENLHAYVFDLPDVVEETRKYIKKFNAERVYTIAGNFFTDSLGSGYDVVFSSYNPGGKKAELIPKIHSCLNTGGIYINKQYFWDKNAILTLSDLEWNLWTFKGFEKDKKLYTFRGDLGLKEYLRELKNTGFDVIKILDFESGSKMIISKRN